MPALKPKGLNPDVVTRLPLSELPSGFTYVRRAVGLFRNDLERFVADATGGSIGPFAAAKIQSACRAERAVQVVERLMRDNWESLTIDQRLAILEKSVRWTADRDKHLEALGLDSRDRADLLPITASVRPPAPLPAIDVTPSPSASADAPAGQGEAFIKTGDGP